jgi:cell division protein ZapA
MERTESEPISVNILDHQYQFACEAGEREALKDAAVFLDGRMRAIKEAGRLMALERIAVMTALNLSDELLKLQKNEKHRQENVDHRIRMLADELDDALDGHLS